MIYLVCTTVQPPTWWARKESLRAYGFLAERTKRHLTIDREHSHNVIVFSQSIINIVK